jgi:diguanylate cyclase (GGDEF)-like protein/PAS domain S-box-containing protein
LTTPDTPAINERFRIALESTRMVVFDWSIHDDKVRLDGYGLVAPDDPLRGELSSSTELMRLIHPDDLPSFLARTVHVLKARGDPNELHHYECRIQAPGGKWLWIEMVGRVTERDAKGRALHMIGTLRDTSQRKLADQQIERLRDLYAALIATSQAIVRCSSQEELFAEICRIAVQSGRFGLAWIGMPGEARRIVPVASYGGPHEYLDTLRVYADPSIPEGRGPTGRAIETGAPSIWNRFLEESASAPWAAAARRAAFQAVASFPIHRAGAPWGALTLYSFQLDHFDDSYVQLLKEMADDISFAIDNFDRENDRREMQRALSESEALQRAVMDAALDCIVSLNAEGRIIHFNPAAERTLGVNAQDALGQPFVELLVPERLRASVAEKISSLSRTPGLASHRTKSVVCRSDGKELRVEIALTSIRVQDNTIVTLHLRDISEIERSEALLQEHALRYRQLVERSPEPVLVHRAGVLLLVNAACLRLFGATQEEELLSRNVSELIGKDHLDAFYDLPRAAESVSQKSDDFLEQTWFALDGSERVLEVAGSELDYAGRPAVQVVLRDVTQRKHSESLQGAQNHVLGLIAQGAELPLIMHTLVEYIEAHAPRTRCTVMILDPTGTMLSQLTAPSFSEAFRVAVENTPLSDSDGLCGVAAFRCEPVIVADVEHDPLTQHWVGLADGEHIAAASSWPVMGRQGQLLGTIALYYRSHSTPDPTELSLLAICTDLAGIAIESRVAEERIRFLAHYDELTALPNRFLFNQLLETALARAQRRGHKIAALFLDLDRFKNINDTLGHAVGDQVLREISGRFRAAVRTSDQLARMGGDEFFLLIDEIDDVSIVIDVARRVLAEAARPFFAGANECQLSASIGISLYPEDGSDAETLLKNSDIAMYRAKSLGKNNFQFYSATKNIHTVERLALESRLRRAIDNHEFVLHYQPRVHLETGRVTGVEALVRWRHPDRGLVSPLEFIPIAEETGLIVALGHQVLAMALSDARRLPALDSAPIRVAVNLSTRQLDDPNLVRDIAALLAQNGLEASRIELEITETMLIHNPDHAEKVINELHQIGLGVSLDDFGTGYSSLTYLKRFPLEAVKIDRSFIKDLPGDANDLAIAEAIIAMAHALDLKVVAEGVETDEQVARRGRIR